MRQPWFYKYITIALNLKTELELNRFNIRVKPIQNLFQCNIEPMTLQTWGKNSTSTLPSRLDIPNYYFIYIATPFCKKTTALR